MFLIASNYGVRLLQHAASHPKEPQPLDVGVMLRLLQLRIDTRQPANDEPWQRELVGLGLAQRVGPEVSEAEVELRYRRNPLEHVERVVFEYTTLCQLDCDHCRNGHVEPATEGDPGRLCEVVDAMVPVGVRRFDFIGGEVLLYGKGWLAVVERARSRGAEVCVVTSGWFVGEQSFRAAGATYPDDRALLSALASAGVTRVTFSLDGPQEDHDRSRKTPGLYRRVMAGLELVREAGMTPQVSLLVSPALGDRAGGWVASVARALYRLPPSEPDAQAAARLTRDTKNYVSNLVDTGNAVRLRRGRHDMGDIPDEALRCKNFFRPYPSLRVQASGEVALCPLVDSGEGYGNVHRRPFVEILNGLQDTFIARLHADRLIGRYRRFLDPELFGGRFDHACGLRTALAMIARRMSERGVGEGDAEAIRAINEEVARKAGFLPASGKTANGTRLPY